MIRGRPAALALGLAVATAPLVAACGTNAVGVDACKQIEEARCRQAPQCQISLEPPYHQTGDDVDACIRYYDTACLHGLSGSDPGTLAVNACVQAIQNNGCSVVLKPESDPACAAFLIPPAPPSLPQDASAGDASSEAGEAGAGD